MIDAVDVLVEIPRGSRNKYEYDEATGRFRLDRVLFASVHYPTEYGFVVGTRAPDGDPLDAIVLTYEATFPGCVIPARPVGILDMRDEKGIDHKVLAVPIGDPRFDEMRDLGDVPHHWLLEIENFFATYKTLEGTVTEVSGWFGAEVAEQIIEACREKV
ncbi:MAG: inorganic diphosphatase [Sphingomonadaceae bacterium]